MDTIDHYKNLIRDYLTEYANLLSHSRPQQKLNIALALDDENEQYLVMVVGWQGKEHVRHTMLHLFIQNNKIWIEYDMTEEGITPYLLKHGVPKEDIVLGFHSPFMRSLTDFAVA